MNFNKTAAALLSAGAVIGTTAVIAMQTHAQQAPSTTPQIQATQQTVTQPNKTAAVQDTDNVQDAGGIEKPDAPETGTSVKQDQETQDDQDGDKDTGPDNGQDDQNETASVSSVTAK